MRESVELPDAAPAGPRQDGETDPAGATGMALAEVLAGVVRVEHVAPDSHFFDDLGADSMVMAQFCARVRKRTDLPSVSMRDIYAHNTISSLVTALVGPAPAPSTNGASAGPPTPEAAERTTEPAPEPVAPPKPVSGPGYVLCGLLQLLTFLGYSYAAGFVVEQGYGWISDGADLLDIYLRSALFGVAGFLLMCALPIAAKWVLIGRWRPRTIRIWSLTYVRFWIVKTMLRFNPMVLFAGSPLYTMYLRALGARIGRGAVLFSRFTPICTDLLTIGRDTVVRKDSYLLGYRARDGVIRTGPITLGDNVFVGEFAVLDIGTSLGDGAQIGHTSSLHTGQTVPAGECWNGSPARPAGADYRLAPANCGRIRRIGYSVMQLLGALGLAAPLVIGGVIMLLREVPQLAVLMEPTAPAFTSSLFYDEALITSFVLFFGSVFGGLFLMGVIPRLLSLAIKPDRVYPLYSLQYALHRAISRLTNIRFFTQLTGDSSAVVHYLRWLGYGLRPVVQTGSNFGTEVKHETPYLSSVGSATMVADGLSMVNADFSSTSFRVSRASIGEHNFVGNWVVYPSQGRTGANCLLATKVMVPVDGPVRENTGLLGSPSFEIPRTVLRDSRLDHLATGEERQRRLARKNRYNAATMVLFLLVWWLHLFGLTLLGLGAAELFPSFGAVAIAAATVLTTVFRLGYFVLVERAVALFRSLKPRYCSIYEPYFWWHERYWKLSYQPVMLDGTPFKSLVWRLLGVRIGRRVFDDGCMVIEKSLVSIGDGCVLNQGTKIQCHSQEDGAFKSDRIALGNGCTVGTGTLVHYGTTMGDGATLSPDAFLMKGEEMPEHAYWGGNPAGELQDDAGTTRPVVHNTAATLNGGKTRWSH